MQKMKLLIFLGLGLFSGAVLGCYCTPSPRVGGKTVHPDLGKIVVGNNKTGEFIEFPTRSQASHYMAAVQGGSPEAMGCLNRGKSDRCRSCVAMKCAACSMATYCSADCQAKDLKYHRFECKSDKIYLLRKNAIAKMTELIRATFDAGKKIDDLD